MNKNERNMKLGVNYEDYEYKFVVFIRRKNDDDYEMVINYQTGKCYSTTTFRCDSSFKIDNYICEENQGNNYPSQLYFFFNEDSLEMVEKVFHDVTGRKFSDLKSKYTNKIATIETVFTNMLPENNSLDCNVYMNRYEFE